MLVIFALLTLLGCTQPAQHKMQLRKITPEMVKMLRKGTWAKYVDEVHKQQQHAHQMDSDGKYEYDVIGYSDIEYIGEVTIGTPEQRFLVLIDTGTTYLWVPDKSCYKQTNRPSECQSSLCDPGSICDVFCSERSCCSLGANDTSNPCRLKRRYDMEKSSSYSKTASRFMIRRKRYVEGSFGKETIRLGELVMPKTWFGQAERMDPSFAHTHFDGVLGLGGKPGAPLRRAVELGLLDQPIYTVFLKRIRNDSDPRCDSDWTYFDLTNSCYYVGSENNFDSAEADCISLGAHLTSIHNGFENNFVSSLTEVGQKQNTNEMTWIGLRYQQNKWTWTDGSDTAYMNWMKGRPEKDASKYPCVQILQDDYKGAKTQWNDVNCGIRMRKYVCKKPASNNAL